MPSRRLRRPSAVVARPRMDWAFARGSCCIHDTPNRENGARRRRRRQPYAQAFSTDVGPDVGSQPVTTIVAASHPAEALPEGSRRAGYAQQPNSCVSHPRRQDDVPRTGLTLPHARPPTGHRGRCRPPPPALTPASTAANLRHQQTRGKCPTIASAAPALGPPNPDARP
jgi:hypothetical protein